MITITIVKERKRKEDKIEMKWNETAKAAEIFANAYKKQQKKCTR